MNTGVKNQYKADRNKKNIFKIGSICS